MSAAAAVEGPSVAVDRLDALCLVAPEHAPDVARDRIDRVARTRLEGALASAVARVVDADDGSVWLIRELQADVALDLEAAAEDALAGDWAEGIARALAATLAAGPDGDRVVRFTDRGAFLARFATDLVAGRAWVRWWYAALEPLRRLPAGTAVREALVATPSDGARALARLAAERGLEAVLDALSEQDARAVLAACFPEPPGPGVIEPELARAALTAMRALARPAPTAACVLRVVLIAAPAGGAGAPRLCRLAERLLAVAALARAVGADDCMRALRAGDALALARVPPAERPAPDLLPELVELAAAEPALVAGAAAVGEPEVVTRATAGTTVATELGGAFLLLPAAVELGLDRLAGGDASLRLQALARCLGAGTSQAAGDPGLLLAAGAEARSLEPPAAVDDALGRLLLERLVSLERLDGSCLAAELAPAPGGEALVLRDVARDAWAYAECAQDPGAALDRGLRLVHEACEARCACLLLGAGLERLAGAAAADAVVTRDRLAAAPAAIAARLERWLTHARPPADLGALAVADVPPGRDLDWSLVAHAIVRGLSGRLLGFDLSSVAYMQRSFLCIRATVDVAEGAIAVELARSPLQIVLQLAGFDGAATVVPWLDAEVTIRLGEG